METDDGGEPFHCLICLELAYKPIVHGCGHLFCFWCVHGAYTSLCPLCPLCRRPYMHVPRVCEQLHFFLRKAVREEYLARAKETREEEVSKSIFSPQFDKDVEGPRSVTLIENYFKEESASRDGDTEGRTDANGSVQDDFDSGGFKILDCCGSHCFGSPSSQTPIVADGNIGPSGGCKRDHTGREKVMHEETVNSLTVAGKEMSKVEMDSRLVKSGKIIPERGADAGPSSTGDGVTVSDLLCTACKRLLYRPIVLNCGHIFCEGCITKPESSQAEGPTCTSCGSPHPGLFLQVCLELHQYLERAFSSEYAKRQHELNLQLIEQLSNKEAVESTEEQPTGESKKDGTLQPLQGPIHIAAGCDGCGMMPIVGRRFNCKGCPEKVGYDLCGRCHETGFFVGRFNQHHTPDHEMFEVQLSEMGRFPARQDNILDTRTGVGVVSITAYSSDSNIAYSGDNFAYSPDSDELETITIVHTSTSAEGAGDSDVTSAENEDVETMANLQSANGNGAGDSIVYHPGNEDIRTSRRDNEEYETSRRDNEEIEIFRVVFHA